MAVTTTSTNEDDSNDYFGANFDYAGSTEKADLLMNKLASGARNPHKRAWKRRRLYRRTHQEG